MASIDQRNTMQSLDFRILLARSLRRFETWARQDSKENPEDYENMGFDRWFEMFNTFLENDEND